MYCGLDRKHAHTQITNTELWWKYILFAPESRPSAAASSEDTAMFLRLRPRGNSTGHDCTDSPPSRRHKSAPQLSAGCGPANLISTRAAADDAAAAAVAPKEEDKSESDAGAAHVDDDAGAR